MKKITAILCFLLTVSLLFSGCAVKEGTETEEKGTQAQTEEVQAPINEKELSEMASFREQAAAVRDAYYVLMKCLFHQKSGKNLEDFFPYKQIQLTCVYIGIICDMGEYEVIAIQRQIDAIAPFYPTYTLHGTEYEFASYPLDDALQWGIDYKGIIFVYQKGVMTTLPEACEQGIVSAEDLKTILPSKGSTVLPIPETSPVA